MSTNNELSTCDSGAVGVDPRPEFLPLLVGEHLLHAGGVVGVVGMVDGRRDHPDVSARDGLQVDGLQAEASQMSEALRVAPARWSVSLPGAV